jgi:hypothetical protein
MTETFGLKPSSDWVKLVKLPPTDQILEYIHSKWHEYAAKYSAIGPSFQHRDEPTLTKGLAAYLADQSEIGNQPFDGDFFGELSHFDLKPDGTTQCTRRTDIEWRLYSAPCFIVEFKVLDGTSGKIKRYLDEGVHRFVDGRYSGSCGEAAMCAFLRKAGSDDAPVVETKISTEAKQLDCHPPTGPHITKPSKLAPNVAEFDTAHSRRGPSVSPISLAHLFIALPN